MAFSSKQLTHITQFFGKLRPLMRRSNHLHVPAHIPTIFAISLTVATLTITVRSFEGLESVELASYDTMVRLRPDKGPDGRLLVVGITEEDLKTLNVWPLTDRIVAQTLAALLKHQPKAIGVDLLRPVPVEPGHQELTTQFKNPKVIAITYIGATDTETVPSPPGMPESRLGFNDVDSDADGVIRRSVMFTSNGRDTFHSLSLRLALTYLKDRNITPEITPAGDYQLGKAVFSRMPATAGGYQTLNPKLFQILLNYRSAHKATKIVTLQQLLNGEVNPRFIENKIVLIGLTAASTKDLFLTPYSPAQRRNPKMAGVMIHAQVVSQILSAVLDDQPLYRFWPEWAENLWIVAWALIGGHIAAHSRRALGLGWRTLAVLGVLFGSSFILFLQAVWIPVTMPVFATLLAGVSVITYRIQQSQQQQQTIMRLLGQQTSPEVAEALWSSRDRLLDAGLLPGQLVTATLLFTDIRNFSTLSEQNSPAVVMAWLNEYLRVMTQVVQAHHGIINKFMGDGIMAVFGVPVPRTTEAEIATDAQRAVNCALAMGERLQQLNRDWKARGLPVIQIRAGIFTGPVMVGSLGGKERLEYGVIGDSVNIASRLESCEKDRQDEDCRILVAGETLVYLPGQFLVEAWGPLALKGKAQTVEVFRILGRKEVEM